MVFFQKERKKQQQSKLYNGFFHKEIVPPLNVKPLALKDALLAFENDQKGGPPTKYLLAT